MGREATGARVLLRTGHKWADREYFNHTGLRNCATPFPFPCPGEAAMSAPLINIRLVWVCGSGRLAPVGRPSIGLLLWLELGNNISLTFKRRYNAPEHS